MPGLPQLPTPLAEQARAVAETHELGVEPDQLRVFAVSEFAERVARQQPDWLSQSLADARFETAPRRADIDTECHLALASVDDMPGLQRELRRLRNRYQLWAIWRHVMGWAPLEETTFTVSSLAEVVLEQALEHVGAWEEEARGVPRSADGARQRLVVFALGKLGAGELNLSSDIDLIFAYPQAGQVSERLTNQQFFVRVGQRLIEALDPVTEDGFVFRVDMRLRPYGDSGPLVAHFSAIETYYETQGRDWERYALIKARAVAGDIHEGAALISELRPFVYRRYLDFGMVQALRDMKARLRAERHQPEDIKLGPGGIRDAEFCVQAYQLIWGGREPALQERNFMTVVGRLRELDRFSPAEAQVLADGYRFLRDLEHSIQAIDDRQTQTLPARETNQQRVALMAGFTEFSTLVEQLDVHRRDIAAVFDALIAPVAHATDAETDDAWNAPEDLEQLAELGFRDPEAASALLGDLSDACERQSVGSESRKRLDALMPVLLRGVTATVDPDRALERVVPILRAILRRSAYVVLLAENPSVLSHLIDLALQSRWFAGELARRPAFFDDLLEDRLLNELPARTELELELRARLDAVADGDHERAMDVLREFKEQHVFLVGLAELRGTLPLMRVSDYLTFLAEAILEAALDLAWRETSIRHPDYADRRPFIVVGYGKLGGLELGPGSDLDLVFIHELPPEASPFLHRLVRRLLHVITVPTYVGALYEIDTRLRPSGNDGTMVSSIEAFAAYQRDRAWVWEHQALVRARPVAGDPALASRFSTLRRELLAADRDLDELKGAVVSMRDRMLAHHSADEDLKRGVGGIVDIEFMVQYLVLAHSKTHPGLSEFTDNVRILEAAERLALLPVGVCIGLRDAYLALRAEWHRTVLDAPDVERSQAVLNTHRDLVRSAWQTLFGRFET